MLVVILLSITNKLISFISTADLTFLVGATFFVFLLVGAAIYMFKKFGLI